MITLEDIRNASILIVDDSADNILLLSEILAVKGYTRVSSTTDSSRVCQLHAKNDYDLILLDMHMPFLHGLDVMKQLQEIEKDAYLPVLAITGDLGYKIAALEAGARDFITKPYNFTELDMRMRNAIEVRLLYKAMAEQSRWQEERALHDALTGLPNRRLLNDRIETAMQYARRHQQMFALMYMDLDGFKQINDQHGHPCGDALLKEVAARLRRGTRQEDTVARIGGDEFIIVLSEVACVDDVVRPASQILRSLAAPFNLGEVSVNVTGSIGIAFYPNDAQDAAALIARADEALYSAKHLGKNCYQFASLPNVSRMERDGSVDFGIH